jgi:serine/threonine-protein kinase
LGLTPGTRLGVYEVTAQIGEGGMGQVFRARDTKLNRDVALKVLPDSFANDPDRLTRFTREAQTLASLNHPNIAHIHGLEESGGVRALVMELVEGENLSQRIAHGAIPLDEALRIANQIAEALEAAHERGIVHRDLKPANIQLRPDGVVKVLDFGLARAIADHARSDPAVSPTMTAMGTRAGMILGTAAYMSPEQARGRPIDKRSDIWAFGCVLYEMLTGTAAFGQDNVPDILAAVLGSEPDWSAIGPSVPAPMRVLVQRCLEKDRTRRISDISTAIFLMNEPGILAPAGNLASAMLPARRSGLWQRIAVAAMVIAVIGSAAALWLGTRPAASRPVARLTITSSGPSALTTIGAGRHLAIAADGKHVVYTGEGSQLFGRALDSLEPVSLSSGLHGPAGFCLSPDGQSVAFVQDYLLKKVAVAGGPVVTLGADDGNVQGMTWGEKGTIVFATDSNATGLLQVPEAGGETKVLTRPNRERGEIDHLWPEFLPGGQAVLFTLTMAGGIDNAQVSVLDLRTGTQKVLIRGGSRARYVPTGHLVYGAAGTLRAIPFDLDRLEVQGESVLVLPKLLTTTLGSADFDVASDGTLVYVPGGLQSPARTLVWVDRQGHEQPIHAPVRTYAYPRISPDGTRAALDIRDQDNDIWIWEFKRETLTRLTTDPTIDRFPVWTTDSRRILFGSDRGGAPNVFWQAADGTTPAEVVTTQTASEQMPVSVTPDGAWAVFRSYPINPAVPQGNFLPRYDLSLVALSKDHRLQPLVHSPSSSEQNGEISPDGRWLAYQSDESGHFEISVQPYPNVNGGRWPVSSDGGVQPVWSHNSRELFYMSPTGAVMRVEVGPGSVWAAGARTKLFDGPYVGGGGEGFGRQYDISPDGRRFLMIKNVAANQASAPQIVVVENWFDELKRLVPTK